ncbi:nucleolar complex protein 2 homolog [Glossina fuscipes]|uniref:Nucleolar complex protein 2 homolog n=1 Tax=Glossina fuscipes TaxID=7396 RepID=A0A8U0WAJ4_9MUSC|nr:nucleolar complex protein 2 homolog [Glossina fuscipes]
MKVASKKLANQSVKNKIAKTKKVAAKTKIKIKPVPVKQKHLKKNVKENKKSKTRKHLEGLKDIDPEFYEFLKKNDKKLLEFNLWDSDDDEEIAVEENKKRPKGKDGKKPPKKCNDSEEDSESASDNVDADEEELHTPNHQLEVASDESDFEDDKDVTAAEDSQKVTLNILRQWQREMENDTVSVHTIRKTVQAFSSALCSISGDGDEAKAPKVFKVVGAAAFNGVVQLCVLHLQPALLRFLGISSGTALPLHKLKKWAKIRSCLRVYLSDLIRLVEQVSSPHILMVLLKHLHQMAAMVTPFSALTKTILKRLIVLWSAGDEAVRVLSFLCILKITRNQQGSMLNHVLKAMYFSYVRNSKFVSPNTLPAINFMRRSLVEMFALDLNVSYQHVFLYVRQLAIHLRNAVILKKKDSFQSVYNWQYVNSLHLWADLLSTTANKPQLQPLVYPLVTITIGAVRLIPTAQYFPLRFHCLQVLISLSKGTNTFIPVLPLILEVLRSNTFNGKHTSVSMKPLQFTCVLRLNKKQLTENGFRDEVVEQVCALSLEYLAFESSSLAFSDLVVPAVVALKGYLKVCRNPNYSRKVKQLLDKIQENAKFVEQERAKITFSLKDLSQVQMWETKIRNKGTPLDIYYNSWVKTHETKKRRQAAQSEIINDDYDLPKIKKLTKRSAATIKDEGDEIDLFPSDSEEESEKLKSSPGAADSQGDEKRKQLTKVSKREKKVKMALGKPSIECGAPNEEPENEEVDILKDLDLDDW